MATQAAPRLRSACTECHASKVKCSGEKTGCVRCRNLGLKCHFGISMVGKCSPIRRRRRPRPNLSDHDRDHEPQHISDDSAVAPSASPEALVQQDVGPLLDWTESNALDSTALVTSPTGSIHDLPHDPMLLQGPLSDELEAFLSSCLGQSEPLFTLDGPRMDHGHAETIESDASTSVQQPSPQYVTKEQPLSLAVTHTRNDISDKCTESLQECFRMISNLEGQLHGRSPSVDEVMQTSKTCAEQLGASMQLECFRRGTAGPLLVLTAAEQITLLFESSLPTLLPERGRMTPPDSSSVNNDIPQNKLRTGYPDLTLGNFRADPEEAGLIWRHVISGELRRILRLVELIGAHRENPLLSTDRIPQGNSRQRLCDGLKQRVKSMIASIGDLREGNCPDMF